MHKARQEAKRLQLKFHIMNKEKLSCVKVGRYNYYLPVADGDLENIQNKLGEETKEGQ